MHVLFWNTWLLRPRILPGRRPLPGSGWLFAPNVDQRASLIGQALAGRFDVCALAECFEPEEIERVVAAWTTRQATFALGPGRGRFPCLTGSGLVTIVDGLNVCRKVRYAFRSGLDWRDPDSFATKGVLLVTLELGRGQPNLEIFSTHLVSGGLQWPGSQIDSKRIRLNRMAQINELIEFIEAWHDPVNAMLLVGDFNVPAGLKDSKDMDSEYQHLAAKLSRLGFFDLWATQGLGYGPTALFQTTAELQPDPDEPDRVVDPETCVLPGERLDMLWLAQPAAETGADSIVRPDRPHRWAFPRNMRYGCSGRLSDHLAVSVRLHFNRLC